MHVNHSPICPHILIYLFVKNCMENKLDLIHFTLFSETSKKNLAVKIWKCAFSVTANLLDVR